MRHARVLRVTSGEKLAAAIPGVYRPLVTSAMRRAGACTVLVFDEGVARIRQAQEAVAELSAGTDSVLAFAGDMTDEARAFLEERSVRVYTLRVFGWTENRHPITRR